MDPRRLEDNKAEVRKHIRMGRGFEYRLLYGVTGKYKVVTDPFTVLLGEFDTEDEARAEAERLKLEGP